MSLEQVIPTSQHPQKSNVAVNDHLTANVSDRPLGVDRVKMRVVNRCTLNLQVEENTITPGTHDVLVYENRVGVVKAMVEPQPEEVAAARKGYTRKIVDAVRKRFALYPGTTDELMAAIDAGTAPEEIADMIKTERAETADSVESVFNERMGRSIQPLDSAEVVGTERYAEPKRAEADKDTLRLTDAMGAAIAQGNAALADAIGVAIARTIGGAGAQQNKPK